MTSLFRGPNSSPNCSQCPCADSNGQPSRPIPGVGKLGSLAIVGEGPSTEEKHQGYPFVGESGKLLNQVFLAGSIDRNSVWITNAILCQRPFGVNADAKLAVAVECCRPRLRHELQLVQPKVVCALGGTAATALQLAVDTITDSRGTEQSSLLLPASTPVVVTIHPAAILRGGAGEVKGGGNQKMNVDAQYPFLESDVIKAHGIANGTVSPWSDDIELITATDAAAVNNVVQLIREARNWGLLGIDLEWNIDKQITWLGIASKHRALSIYWPHIPVASVMFGVLRDAGKEVTLGKLFHNLQADIAVWEACIGPINGNVEDTMLLHHAAHPGAPHDLQQVTSQLLRVPPWKASRANEEKAFVKSLADKEREARKTLRKAEHDARNAQRKSEAAAKRAAKAAAGQGTTTPRKRRNSKVSQTTIDDILSKILED